MCEVRCSAWQVWSQKKEKLMADTKGKSRVTNWTTSQNKVFLNLLFDQYHKNMCNQGTFKQHIWNDIVGPFNAHTKKEANTNNLMNRWKNMKKQYRLLEQLLSRTGWSWNDVTKMPVPAEESAWAEAIVSNSEYKKFLGKPYEYKEEMDILCANIMSRGCIGFGIPLKNDLARRRSRGDEDSPHQQMSSDDSNRRQLNAMGLGSNASPMDLERDFNPSFILRSQGHMPIQTHGRRSTPSSTGGCSATGEYTPSPIAKQPNEDEATSLDKTKRCATPSYRTGYQKRNKTLDNAIDALNRFRALNDKRMEFYKILGVGYPSTTSSSEQTCTIKDCLHKLKSLPGYTPDILYTTADRFQDPHFRSVFMALDDDDKLGWIFYRGP